MHIIALAAAKGGVGKTTLSAALAVSAFVARPGIKVGLVDLDPQGSLTAWWNGRARPEPQLLRQPDGVFTFDATAARAEGFDLIILDCPPGFSEILIDAIRAADLVLVPTGPSSLDLEGIGAPLETARAFEMPAHIILNKAIFRSRLAGQAVRKLREMGSLLASVVHYRVAIGAAMGEGLTAQEFEPRGAAARELGALWATVEALLVRGEFA